MVDERNPVVEIWNKSSGSMPYYVEERLAEAHRDNAPRLATYKRDDGTWRTLDQVTNPETQVWWMMNHPDLAKEAGFTE